jgi:hypothetical protein
VVKLTPQPDDPLTLARIAVVEEGAEMVVMTGRAQGFMSDISTDCHRDHYLERYLRAQVDQSFG